MAISLYCERRRPSGPSEERCSRVLGRTSGWAFTLRSCVRVPGVPRVLVLLVLDRCSCVSTAHSHTSTALWHVSTGGLPASRCRHAPPLRATWRLRRRPMPPAWVPGPGARAWGAAVRQRPRLQRHPQVRDKGQHRRPVMLLLAAWSGCMRQCGTWVGQRVRRQRVSQGRLSFRVRRRRGVRGRAMGVARQGTWRMGRRQCGWAWAEGERGLGRRTLGRSGWAGRSGRGY